MTPLRKIKKPIKHAYYWIENGHGRKYLGNDAFELLRYLHGSDPTLCGITMLTFEEWKQLEQQFEKFEE